MTQHVETAVRKTITVAASQQRAFAVFTAQLGSWWPKEHHISESEVADFILEPMVGGRWYERGVDGQECDCGQVTAFDPADRLALAWHLNASWQYDPDPAHASEVEVRFIAEGPTHTRIELAHRGFERHGAGGDAIRQSVDTPRGWMYCLDQFAQRVAA